MKERSHVCIPVYIRGKYPQLRKFANAPDPYRIFGHRTLYGLEILMDKIGAEGALDAAKEFLREVEALVK